MSSIFVPVGSSLTITANAVSAATYWRINTPGTDPSEQGQLTAAGSVVLGPFNEPRNYGYKSNNGDVTAVIGQANLLADDDTAYQPVLSGATLTAVTVATNDLVVIQDASDTKNIKTVTTQAIADLAGSPADSTISFTDITTNNVSITKHGFAPKAPNDATKYLDGTGAYTTPSGGAPAESAVTFTDITTNNSSTSKHGFLKKLDGTATNYMDGSGNWSAPAGGGSELVFIAAHTASNSATLDFTDLADYASIHFVLQTFTSSTTNAVLWIRASADNGSTFAADATSYYGSCFGNGQGGTVKNIANNGSAAILCTGILPNGGGGINGDMDFYNIASADLKTMMGRTNYYDGANFEWTGLAVQSIINIASAVNAVRFMFSSGNIVSGTIYAYGLKKS